MPSFLILPLVLQNKPKGRVPFHQVGMLMERAERTCFFFIQASCLRRSGRCIRHHTGINTLSAYQCQAFWMSSPFLFRDALHQVLDRPESHIRNSGKACPVLGRCVVCVRVCNSEKSAPADSRFSGKSSRMSAVSASPDKTSRRFLLSRGLMTAYQPSKHKCGDGSECLHLPATTLIPDSAIKYQRIII